VTDNITIAILTRVNDLAARFGLRPTDFVAVIDESDASCPALRFEVPVSGDPAKEAQFHKMLDLIGISDTSHALPATYDEMFDAVDNALRRAPRRRPHR